MPLHQTGVGQLTLAYEHGTSLPGVGEGVGEGRGKGDNSHCSIDGFQQLHMTLSGC